MSKKAKNQNTKFAYTTTAKVPKMPVIKTNWALSTLYYKNEKDPRIEQDLKIAEKAYANFAKKYGAKLLTKNNTLLLQSLKDYEKLGSLPELSKPGRYFSFRSALDAKDVAAEKQLVLIGNRMRKAANSILFYELEIGKMSRASQAKILKDARFSKYHYLLERIFLEAKHTLSLPEEKILSLKANTSYGMWVDAVEKLVSKRTITYKNETMGVNEAIERIDTLPSKEKPRLWELIMREMKEIGEVAESEMTAIINDAKIDDELRGYKKPYSSTLLSYEDDEKSIEALLEAVRTKGFELSKRFYKLKAKYHNVKQLHYAQKYDSIGETAVIPFEQAVDVCRDVFYGVHTNYGEIFDTMLKNGQIDVYPKSGKRGGAFMSNATNLPTHVFLNHTNNMKSLETLAHEMGHAIHSERSKCQPIMYQNHSITTAETASTLFENLVFDKVYEQASIEQKPILLHERITRDIATIERQIAFFNAELEMHNRVRSEGALSNEDLRDIMERHLKSYLGPGVSVTKDDGYSYAYVHHFRYGFYVYTYTFGILMSSIMAQKYREDTSYKKQIDIFLSSGKNATVADIFASIGIHTKKTDTFAKALDSHAADIDQFAKWKSTIS